MSLIVLKQWFLPEVGESARKGIIQHNIYLIDRVLPIFTGLVSILLVIYAVMFFFDPVKHGFALLSILVCLALFVGTIVLFRYMQRNSQYLEKRSTRIILDLIYWAFSSMGILVSWQMYLRGNQMLLMDTVQIAFALLVCSYPLYGVIRVIISYVILFAFLYYSFGAAQINPAIYCLMGSMVCFCTVLRYGMELKNITQMQALASHARDLEHRSSHDELTGMKNRLALRQAFPGYCGQKLWVVMTDVDHFKRYNDTYGHAVGDQILTAVSSEIINHFGRDCCYRYGGDEFLIILGDLERSEVTTLLMVWAETIRHMRLDIIPEEHDFSCSYGFVSGTPANVEELRTMVVRADKKLYEMKAVR